MVEYLYISDQWPEYGAHLAFEFASITSPHSTHNNSNSKSAATGDHIRLRHPLHSQHFNPNHQHDLHFEKNSTSADDRTVGHDEEGSVTMQSKLVVRVVYNNRPIMIPSCGAMWCPFPSLMDILKPYSMTHGEYKTRCHNENIV